MLHTRQTKRKISSCYFGLSHALKNIILLLVLLITTIFIRQQLKMYVDDVRSPSPPIFDGCRLFPSDSIWNYDISSLPLNSNSANYMRYYANNVLTARFTNGEAGNTGYPYIVVSSMQPMVPMKFILYPTESDPGPYPVPTNAPIEDLNTYGSDRHVLVLQTGTCKIYELDGGYPQADGSWIANNGDIFDLNSDSLRPNRWTSVDAAGIPLFPGNVMYDEVASGQIRHALRFLLPTAQHSYLWPARHTDGQTSSPNAPPEGLRIRLKAGVDISSFPPLAKIILTALKHYGMILQDTGVPSGIVGLAGSPDSRWSMSDLVTLDKLHFSDFEAIDESSLQVSPDSAQAYYPTAITNC